MVLKVKRHRLIILWEFPCAKKYTIKRISRKYIYLIYKKHYKRLIHLTFAGLQSFISCSCVNALITLGLKSLSIHCVDYIMMGCFRAEETSSGG